MATPLMIDQWAILATPLMVGFGSWLTYLAATRSSHQAERKEERAALVGLVDQHTEEIARLRAQINDRDRIASDTWTQVIELRRRVLSLETQLHRLWEQATALFAQVRDLGAIPVVELIDINEEELGE